MDAIYIPQVAKAPDKTETIQVKQNIHGFKSLTPVQGYLSVTHCGKYLEITASVETIATLICDRCLQNYNHRLTVNASELIWLDEILDSEADNEGDEFIADDLVETLSSNGYFDPEIWLYEYLCLSLPQQQLCDQNCTGIQVNNSESSNSTVLLDSRWGPLEALKGKMLN